MWRLIDRTLTHHEKAYDNLPIDEQLTTQVRLTLTDGTTQSAKITHPRGTGDRSLTNAEIRDKFAKLTNHPIASERRASIEQAVLNLEKLDDIAQLTKLLTPTVQSPLDRGPNPALARTPEAPPEHGVSMRPDPYAGLPAAPGFQVGSDVVADGVTMPVAQRGAASSTPAARTSRPT